MPAESVESLCQKARQSVAQGDLEAARKFYLQALGQKSDAPDVHYGLATVCFMLEDLDSAAYHFKEVTRLDPLRAGAHINLGAVYNRQGDYEEAIRALRRGMQIDPQRAEGYYNLGLVYRNKGQNNLAAQMYIEATRLNPRMIDAHYNLANLYLEAGRFKQAVQHYRQVLQLRPKWEKAEHGLAEAEAALKAEEAGPTAPPETPAKPAAAADANRTVDPAAHGAVLTNLQQAAVDSETQGRQFMQILEREVEPAIKELSACLLHPAVSSANLDQCIQKFENALQNMRKTQRQLQSSIQRVRQFGDQLLKS